MGLKGFFIFFKSEPCHLSSAPPLTVFIERGSAERGCVEICQHVKGRSQKMSMSEMDGLNYENILGWLDPKFSFRSLWMVPFLIWCSDHENLAKTKRTSFSAPPMTTNKGSRWQKLFSAFKKNKGGGSGSGGGAGGNTEAFCLKHSHNCSNSFLRAGISNMKGYKKTNQDR